MTDAKPAYWTKEKPNDEEELIAAEGSTGEDGESTSETTESFIRKGYGSKLKTPYETCYWNQDLMIGFNDTVLSARPFADRDWYGTKTIRCDCLEYWE